MTAIKLAPSILTADFGHIADQIRAAEAGGADYVHLDVMDGHFVPPITFGPLIVEAVRKATKLPIDLHLMIERPEGQFDAFVDAGADIINFHIEATAHADRLLRSVHTMRKRAGICINPATPGPSSTVTVAANQRVFFSVFIQGQGHVDTLRSGELPGVHHRQARHDASRGSERSDTDAVI